MSQPHNPKPLRSDTRVPPELRRALDSMRDGRVDAARVERVGARLDALLEGPLPASTLWRYGRAKTLATKLVIATIAVGTPVFFLARMKQSEPVRAPVVDAPLVASDRESARGAPEIVAAPRELSPASEPRVEAQPPPSARGEPERHRTRRERASGSNGSRRSARSEERSTRGATTSQAAIPSQVTTREQRAVAHAPEAVVEPLAEAPPKPAPAAAADAGAPRLNESELLLAAHQKLHQDPKAVLRMVAEHEARYPSGLLVPEREVLAIQALRKLERDNEATQRSNRLRERYPEYFKQQRVRAAAKSE